MWVDGLQNQVFVSVKAFEEILMHLVELDIRQDMDTPTDARTKSSNFSISNCVKLYF